jgi:hypothetical protein
MALAVDQGVRLEGNLMTSGSQEDEFGFSAIVIGHPPDLAFQTTVEIASVFSGVVGMMRISGFRKAAFVLVRSMAVTLNRHVRELSCRFQHGAWQE